MNKLQEQLLILLVVWCACVLVVGACCAIF